MGDLLADAKELLADIQEAPNTTDVERGLRAALEPFVSTLEAEQRPQRPSTDTLSRFCVEHMDWDTPLYRRCSDLVTRAKASL